MPRKSQEVQLDENGNPIDTKDTRPILVVRVDPNLKAAIQIQAIREGHGRNFGPFVEKVFEAGLDALGFTR